MNIRIPGVVSNEVCFMEKWLNHGLFEKGRDEEMGIIPIELIR